ILKGNAAAETVSAGCLLNRPACIAEGRNERRLNMADKKFPHTNEPLDVMEQIKTGSDYLRGTIEEGLTDRITAAISEEDTKLLKFHGSYQQDDRDVRDDRRRKKLEPAYQFMIRVRAPGGVATPEQWLTLDKLAGNYANGTLKLTTRQSFQFHGRLEWNLKNTMREINGTQMDTLASCGDFKRKVMCKPHPHRSKVPSELYEWSKKLSEHLSPKTNAYHEIWLDDAKVLDTRE